MAASRLNCIIIYNMLLKKIKIYDKIYLQFYWLRILLLKMEKGGIYNKNNKREITSLRKGFN